MATTSPASCRRRHLGDLVLRKHVRANALDPDGRGDRLRGALVVAGEEHRREVEAPELRDRLRARRLDPVGDDEQPAHGAVPAGGDDGAPFASASSRASAGGSSRPPSARRGGADDRRVALDEGLDAEPGAVREALDRRQRAEPRAPLGDRRAIGCSLASSDGAGDAEQVVAGHAVRRGSRPRATSAPR